MTKRERERFYERDTGSNEHQLYFIVKMRLTYPKRGYNDLFIREARFVNYYLSSFVS